MHYPVLVPCTCLPSASGPAGKPTLNDLGLSPQYVLLADMVDAGMYSTAQEVTQGNAADAQQLYDLLRRRPNPRSQTAQAKLRRDEGASTEQGTAGTTLPAVHSSQEARPSPEVDGTGDGALPSAAQAGTRGAGGMGDGNLAVDVGSSSPPNIRDFQQLYAPGQSISPKSWAWVKGKPQFVGQRGAGGGRPTSAPAHQARKRQQGQSVTTDGQNIAGDADGAPTNPAPKDEHNVVDQPTRPAGAPSGRRGQAGARSQRAVKPVANRRSFLAQMRRMQAQSRSRERGWNRRFALDASKDNAVFHPTYRAYFDQPRVLNPDGTSFRPDPQQKLQFTYTDGFAFSTA